MVPSAAGRVRPETLTDEQVRWAIEAMMEGLYARQNNSGTWESLSPDPALSHINTHLTGQTTIAVLSLLAAGESYQEPRLQTAIDFLRSQKPDFTYVRSLRCHIWALLPERFTPLLENDLKWLLGSYGFESGSWAYTGIAMESGYDNSLTQYGLLGLWEAAKRNQEVPKKYWQRIEDHYLRTQLVEGGWNYRPQFGDARGSMTAAGLTCLFVTQDFLHAEEFLKPGVRGTPQQQAIDRGLSWLDLHFSADHHPGLRGDDADTYFFYYLYGIERVGLASGYKWFSNHDWFREGATAIINRTCDAAVDPETGRIAGFQAKAKIEATGAVETPVVQLAFGLMFLTHGRVPIIVSKLRDEAGLLSWNNRPRDAAQLTSWVARDTEQHLSWQVLDLKRPLDEWFDGPFVYLASHDAPRYLEEHQAEIDRRGRERAANERTVDIRMTTVERLQRYLDLGGLLFTNADGASARFEDAIRTLGREMYPQYDWRQLPRDHWVYTLSAPVLDSQRDTLWGLSNGVRELMIHCPSADFGAELQVNDVVNGRDAFHTMSNVYFYASERGLAAPRLDRKLFLSDAEVHRPTGAAWSTSNGAPAAATESGDPERRPITVLRGVYVGNWNPEPAADEVIAARLRASRDLNVVFVDVPLEEVATFELPPGRGEPALLWVRGTTATEFATDQAAAVRTFVNERGGTVLFENVGGLSDFGRTAEEFLENALPGGRFRRPIDHPVVTGEGLARGQDASEIAYRVFSLEKFGARETKPRLRALHIEESGTDAVADDETRGDAATSASLPRVFVSREDLTHALLGQPRWGISGYTPPSAETIVANLIEFADR